MASDTTLNRYLVWGTDAERLAFTPSPASLSGIGPGDYLGVFWQVSDAGSGNPVYMWSVPASAWILVSAGTSARGQAIASYPRSRTDDNTKVYLINQGTSGGGGGSGTVTSVALTIAGYTISGSPVTTSGTLAATMATGAGAIGSVLLEEHTASSSAELDFTTWYSSTYDVYEVSIVNLVPATNAISVLLRVSTTGGASYDSGTNYSVTANRTGFAGNTAFGGLSQTGIDLTVGDTLGNSATVGGGLTATLRILGPNSGQHTRFLGLSGYLDSSGGTDVVADIAARYKSTSAVNAFQVICSSGNIASGTIRVYGYAK